MAHILENENEMRVKVFLSSFRLSMKIGELSAYDGISFGSTEKFIRSIQLILFVSNMLSPTPGHRDLASNRAQHFMK